MKPSNLTRIAGLMGAVLLSATSAVAQLGAGPAPAHNLRVDGQNTDCDAPPRWHCPDEACLGTVVTQPGDTVEMKTRRPYFLDCPKGYKAGDKVNVLLLLHGFGSYANWTRMYFPAVDVKDKYHLVVITPGSPTRSWSEYDDEYLHNIVDSVVSAIGKQNVDHFILAGHSQGGATSSRLVCTPYFRDKVDVRVSLSGGRMGPTLPGKPGVGVFGGGGLQVYQDDPDHPPAPPPARGGVPGRGGAAGAAPARGGAPGRGALPPGFPAPTPVASGSGPNDCDYSFIYSAGEYENIPAPASDPATKFGCGPRQEQPDVVDPKKGYVYDSTRQDPGGDPWGRYPRSGRAHEWVYPNCKDGRVVADFSKLNKGHTEGYEPNITDEIIRVALTAKGGKIAGGSWSPPAAPAPAAGRGGIPGRAG